MGLISDNDDHDHQLSLQSLPTTHAHTLHTGVLAATGVVVVLVLCWGSYTRETHVFNKGKGLSMVVYYLLS